MQSSQQTSPMANIGGYLDKLQALSKTSSNSPAWNINCENALNGEASLEVQKSIGIDVRRHYGVFFTGNELSKHLLNLRSNKDTTHIYFDPTCGMGDLLITAAKLLPLGKCLNETLEIWGKHLMGTDLHPEFIKGAKLRLILLARQLNSFEEIDVSSEEDFFPYIQVANV